MGINILLICGSGASTGYLVQRMRKVATKRGIEAEINARSDSELPNLVNTVDVVLAGPHLRHQEAKIKEICSRYGTPYDFIDTATYGMLDGEKALDQALNLRK